MKIALISDVHLGDPLCTLVEKQGSILLPVQSIKNLKMLPVLKTTISYCLGISLIFQ